jgi:transcriptional regulator with XRE-family HTH domain
LYFWKKHVTTFSCNSYLKNKNLGTQIKAIRLAKNYPQRYLAEALGISQPYLSRIERNEIGISDQHLEQLSVIFKLSIHFIKSAVGETIQHNISPNNIPKLIEQYEKMVDTQNRIMLKQQQDNEKLEEMILKHVKEIELLNAIINELRNSF